MNLNLITKIPSGHKTLVTGPYVDLMLVQRLVQRVVSAVLKYKALSHYHATIIHNFTRQDVSAETIVEM